MEKNFTKINKTKYLNDEIIKTIDLIAKARDNELSFDKTIIAKIIKINNVELGEYYVEYQQGIFKAYTSQKFDFIYDEGTSVYVKVPCGDFTQKKIIEGKTNEGFDSETDYDYLSNQVLEVHNFNLGDIFENLEQQLNIPEQQLESINLYQNEEPEQEQFKNLFNNYKKIKLEAQFLTNFTNPPIYGNYGLKVIFYQKMTENVYHECIRYLDKKNFIGAINEYSTYSKQYAIYEFSGNDENLTGIKSIDFFCTDYKDVDIDDYIKIKSPKIIFVERLNETEKLYFAGIKALDGLTLMNSNDRIELEGVFYYSGKSIIDSNCECYWFKQKPEILETDKRFNSWAGPGWEQITIDTIFNDFLENTVKLEDIKRYLKVGEYQDVVKYKKEYDEALENYSKAETYEQKLYYNNLLKTLKENLKEIFNKVELINYNKIIIRGSEVYSTLKIKFVVVYNKTKSFSKEITLKNYEGSNRFSMLRDNVNGERLTFRELNQNKIADWYVLLSNGNYYCLEKNTSSVNIEELLKYPKIDFSLLVHLSNGKSFTYNYTLINYAVSEDIVVDFQGNGLNLFLYDENNLLIQNLIEYSIIPVIQAKEGIYVKNIKWYSPEGVVVTQETTFNSQSLINTQRISLEDNGFYFYPNLNFDSLKTKNTLTLKIETSENKVYTFYKTILFSKQGLQDSTGVKYNLEIKPCNEKGEDYYLTPLLYKKNEWTPIYLKVQLYRNGVIINNNNEFSLKAKGFNICIEEIDSNKHIYKISKTLNLFSKIKTQVKNKDGEDEKIDISLMEIDQGQYFVNFNCHLEGTTIYLNKFYPILIAYGDLNLNLFSEMQIPNYVEYNMIKKTIFYENKAIKIKYKDIVYPQSGVGNDIQVYNSEVLNCIKLESSNIFTIAPSNKFKGFYFLEDENTESELFKNRFFLNQETQILAEEETDTEIPIYIRSPLRKDMSAIKFEIDSDENKFIIQPIVMIYSSDLNISIADYEGNNILVKPPILDSVDQQQRDVPLSEDDGNNYINLTINSGLGKITDKGFSGTVLGTTDESNNSSGVFLINQENIISTFFKNDGSFNLGGMLSASYREDGSLDLKINEDFLKELKNQLKNIN